MTDEFDSFVRARSAALLRSAYLLTGDQQLAEDLVQTALARTHRSWRRLDQVSNAEAYTRRTMYHLQVSWWRRRRVAEVLSGDLPEPRQTTDESDRAALRLTLRAALLKLSPKQRAVLVLRFFEDRSEAETAELLGVAVGTVKSQTGTTPAESPDASPSASPSVSRSVPSGRSTLRILPGRLFYQALEPMRIQAWDGDTVTKILQPADTTVPAVVRISPDGARFVRVTNANQLYVADADGSGAREVRDNVLQECVEPVWTADSRRVLVAPLRFVNGRPEGHDLGYLDVASGAFQAIGDIDGCHFVMSPGDAYLARVDGSKGEVSISRPDGSGSRVVPVLGNDDPRVNPQRARSFDIHSLSPYGNLLMGYVITGDEPWGDVALRTRANAVIDTRTGKQVALPANGELLNGVFLADGSLLARLAGRTRNELVLISKDWKVLDRIDEPAELKDQWLQAYLPG